MTTTTMKKSVNINNNDSDNEDNLYESKLLVTLISNFKQYEIVNANLIEKEKEIAIFLETKKTVNGKKAIFEWYDYEKQLDLTKSKESMEKQIIELKQINETLSNSIKEHYAKKKFNAPIPLNYKKYIIVILKKNKKKRIIIG